MQNKFKTYMNLNDTTRYIILYRNENGRQCRIDCHSCYDLDNVGDFKLCAPIYVYKIDSTIEVHGNARKKFIDNLILKQTKGIRVVRQIEDNSKILTRVELSILLWASVKAFCYPNTKMSQSVLNIIYGGGTEKYRVNNIELTCTKYNFIDSYAVKNLLDYRPYLLPKLKILFKNI